MAWIRQLESGLWAATVYTPLGDRVTDSHRLKTFITNWANKLEAGKVDGSFIDPRLGKIPLGEIWDLYADDRRLEYASKKRDQSHWNKWVGPTWNKRHVGPVRKPHVTAWIADIHRKGAKGWTQQAALGVLRSMFEISVDLGLIAFNPTAGVRVDPPDPHEDRVLEDFEDGLLLANLEQRFPGLPEAAMFVEMMLYTGVRYEELAPLRRSAVRPQERGFWVHRVMEKTGEEREYAKTVAGNRFVPLDDELWPRFIKHVLTIQPDGRVFTAPDGGPLLYDNWLKRVWNKGLLEVVPWSEARVEQWKEERREAGERAWKVNYFDEAPILDAPRPTPHDCRHTYGTRSAELGIPRHELAANLGQSPTSRAVDRYLHARKERHDRARAAMAAVRKRRAPTRPGGEGSCVHCGQLLPMSYDLEKQR